MLWLLLAGAPLLFVLLQVAREWYTGNVKLKGLPGPPGSALPLVGHMLPTLKAPTNGILQMMEGLWAAASPANCAFAARPVVWKAHVLGEWGVVFSGPAGRTFAYDLESTSLLFQLPRLPQKLLPPDNDLMQTIVAHQRSGHSAAAADFQAWRRERTKGMLLARNVAGTVPAVRRTCQRHIREWCQRGQVTSEDLLRLVFDVAVLWALGEEVRDRMAEVVADFFRSIHCVSKAMFGAPVEFLPGTDAWKGLQALPECRRLARVLVEAVATDAVSTSDGSGQPELPFPRLVTNLRTTAAVVTGHSALPYSPRLEAGLIGDVFAAFHTTSGLLSGELYHLAKYPEAQAAARTCVASIAADRDDGAAFLHAMRGSYIEHFVSETLRVASPAVLGVRRAASAVVVPSSLTGAAPVTIPAGTAVMVHHTSDHFDPELFPEPHRFHPLRWATRASEGPGELGPRLGSFGHRTHACLGRAFASAVSNTFLSELLQATEAVAMASPDATQLQQFPSIALVGAPLVLVQKAAAMS